MKALFARGEPGQGISLFYAAKVDRMHVGVGRNKETNEHYSTIDLEYPERLLPTVLKVVREMSRLDIFPEVYIVRKAAIVDIVVLFRLRPISDDVLEVVIPADFKDGLSSEMRDEEVNELVMTGESEFIGKEVKPFLRPIRRGETFRVHIVREEGGERRALWGVRLSTFKEEPPQIRR